MLGIWVGKTLCRDALWLENRFVWNFFQEGCFVIAAEHLTASTKHDHCIFHVVLNYNSLVIFLRPDFV